MRYNEGKIEELVYANITVGIIGLVGYILSIFI